MKFKEENKNDKIKKISKKDKKNWEDELERRKEKKKTKMNSPQILENVPEEFKEGKKILLEG